MHRGAHRPQLLHAAKGLESPAALTVSPDGGEVYVTDNFRPTVATLRRDPTTGSLRPAGLLGKVCPPKACGSGQVGAETRDPVAAPDGRSLYVTTEGEFQTVQILDRTSAGRLRRRPGPSGCYEPKGRGGCLRGRGLRREMTGLTVSPDGRSLYVTSGTLEGFGHGGSVAVFDRAADGALTQPGGKEACLAVTITGCAKVPSLAEAMAVTVSPDGTTAYVGTLGGVTLLTRGLSGLLTSVPGPGSCISRSRRSCTKGRIEIAAGVVVSPDGANLYVTDEAPGGISVFAIAPTTAAP